MTSRQIIQHVAVNEDGTVQKNKTVLVKRATDGTTPFAGNLYDVATGGTPLVSLSTNNLGLFQAWTDYLSGEPVEITVDGVTPATKSDFAYASTDILVQSMTSAAALSGGITVTRASSSAWAARIQNTEATNGLALLVEDPEGHDFFSIRRHTAAGDNGTLVNDIVAIISPNSLGVESDFPTTTSNLWVIHVDTRNGYDGNYVNADFKLDHSGTIDGLAHVPDASALRATAEMLTTGRASIIGAEVHALRASTADDYNTWCLAMSPASQHDSAVVNQNGGAICVSDNKLWYGAGAAYVPQSFAFLASGANTYYSGFIHLDASGGVLFRTAGGAGAGDTAGDVVSGRLRPLATGTYDVGTTSVLWRVLYAQRFKTQDGAANAPVWGFNDGSSDGVFHVAAGIGIAGTGAEVGRITSAGVTTVAGSAGTPALGFTGDPDTGAYNISANILGISTGGTERARFSSAGVQTIAGSSAAPSFSFTGDPNTGIYNVTADSIGFVSGGTDIMRMDSGLVDFRTGGVALGGGAAPTLGTIGGSGPATAGQNSWLKINIAGVASFLGVWR